MDESPIFNQQEADQLKPGMIFKELVQRHRKGSVVIMLVAAFAGINLYVGNIYWCTYATSHGYFSLSEANMITFVDAIVEFFALPTMAILAFRIGARKVIVMGIALVLTASAFHYYLTELGSYLVSSITMMVYALGVSAFEAPMFDQFPGRIRCTVIAFAWAIGHSLFSSPSLMVAQLLSDQLDWMGSVLCIYISCAAGLLALSIGQFSSDLVVPEV
ncbi:MAG: hypothetical protein ACPGEF_00195 [Endozoicomonas sp.]